LELSRSTWLITSLSPGGGEKMSKQVVRGGDVAGLLERFARLREKTRVGHCVDDCSAPRAPRGKHGLVTCIAFFVVSGFD
jgi:hypothetical protein